MMTDSEYVSGVCTLNKIASRHLGTVAGGMCDAAAPEWQLDT